MQKKDKGGEAPAVWSSEVSDDEIDGIVAAVSFRQFSQPRSRLALLAERSEPEDKQANPDLILALPRPPRMLEQARDPTCSDVSSIAQLQRLQVGRMVAVTEMSLTRRSRLQKCGIYEVRDQPHFPVLLHLPHVLDLGHN